MARRKVTLGKDHTKRIGEAYPIPALAELIGNSFDAGANTVNFHEQNILLKKINS